MSGNRVTLTSLWKLGNALRDLRKILRQRLRQFDIRAAALKTAAQNSNAPPETLAALAQLEETLFNITAPRTLAALQRRSRWLFLRALVFRVVPSVGLHPAEQLGPPNRACFLLDLLLAEADREVIPGDLEEEFTTVILPKYGARRARLWFWMQTVRTIARRNPICRWVLVYGITRLGEWVLHKLG
jgi:hypothetical protein